MPRVKRVPDKYEMYEETVQDAPGTATLLDRAYRRLRGRNARLLREDFAGTAALACAWAGQRKDNRALAVDLDPEPLRWRKSRGVVPAGVTLKQGNVLDAHGSGFDLIAAFNYSWLALRRREELRQYLRRVRAALAPDGVFALDLYGGVDALREGDESTRMKGWTYVWDQEKVDPTTGETWCSIHWKLGRRTIRRSFTYHWRLWSLSELWDLFEDTGLKRLEILAEDDSPVDGRYRTVKRVPNWDSWNIIVLAERA